MSRPKRINWELVARTSMHPVAIAVVEEYAKANGVDGKTPTAVADALGMRLQNVSYHVRQLAAGGVLELVKTEPVRGTLAHYYRLTK